MGSLACARVGVVLLVAAVKMFVTKGSWVRYIRSAYYEEQESCFLVYVRPSALRA